VSSSGTNEDYLVMPISVRGLWISSIPPKLTPLASYSFNTRWGGRLLGTVNPHTCEVYPRYTAVLELTMRRKQSANRCFVAVVTCNVTFLTLYLSFNVYFLYV
jgi:hypothetical protein